MAVKLEKLSASKLYKRVAALTHERDELQRKLEKAESAVVTGLESIDNSLHVLRVETARSQALALENSELKSTLEHVINPDNQPEYHDQGMGCGVEDRGYQRDGYTACYYGWESAMERVYSEVIPSAVPETPATDAVLAEIRAQAKRDGVQLAFDTLDASKFGDAGDIALLAKLLVKLRKEPSTHE